MLAQQRPDGLRLGAVGPEVAEADQPIGAPGPRVGDEGPQRVGVE